jgi:hypothetical protein
MELTAQTHQIFDIELLGCQRWILAEKIWKNRYFSWKKQWSLFKFIDNEKSQSNYQYFPFSNVNIVCLTLCLFIYACQVESVFKYAFRTTNSRKSKVLSANTFDHLEVVTRRSSNQCSTCVILCSSSLFAHLRVRLGVPASKTWSMFRTADEVHGKSKEKLVPLDGRTSALWSQES